MFALLKLVPFKDWLIAAAVAALVIFYNVHVHDLEVSYSNQRVAAVNAAYKKGSDEANAAAAAKIARQTKEYADASAETEARYEKLIQANDAANAADAKRLRQLAADSEQRADAVLRGSGGAGAPADGGNQGAGGLGSVPAGLALELSGALRQDDAALTKCYDDRASIPTGK